MLSDTIVQIAVLGLAALSVGLIVFFLIYPYVSGEKKADERRQSISNRRVRRGSPSSNQEELNQRRKQVQEALQELEKKQKEKTKVTTRMRLVRAGLNFTPRQFHLASLSSGLLVGGATYILGAMSVVAVALTFVASLGLPRWVLNFLTKKRQKKFINEFANVTDVIVRGVKSGLPLSECLEIIARESPEPIKSEFVELVEQNRVGVPLNQCFDRMMQRVPLPEVNFFATVIAIQQQAGGSLSEALSNLGNVLRARKQMAAKVRALSAEANTSAGILAALPFFVIMMVYITTPDYISLFWKDSTGHVLLAGSGIWMTIGVIIMRKMIKFKY